VVANSDTHQPARPPEGKEGAGSHQEGKHSVQAGQTQRRKHSVPEKSKPYSARDHQKTGSDDRSSGRARE